MSKAGIVQINLNTRQLTQHAEEFLSSPKKSIQKLLEIVQYFQACVENDRELRLIITVVEKIFTELFRRRVLVKLQNEKDNTTNAKLRESLLEHFREVLRLLLVSFEASRLADIETAVTAAVRLLASEGKYPIEQTKDAYYFPINRLRNILARLLSTERSQQTAISAFRQFASGYLDVLYFAWKLLPGLTKNIVGDTSGGAEACQHYIDNYLDVVAALPITAAVQATKQHLCVSSDDEPNAYNHTFQFDYATVRSNINKSWMRSVGWPLTEQTHRKLLIVLLESVLTHLDKPVLLTDFLMDSLNVGGPISLLALQGVFTLIQQHNLTYPNVYEKLYSMFDPEIFHTKFKARLFYLTDIFLSSIALPEMLVAAFVKRLSRLALVAPPPDIVIILRLIVNLIIRHPGLKRLMCHYDGSLSVATDPYQMDEPQPTKAQALESSLWEVVSLQSHSLPHIAQAARFVQNPLPSVEVDLSDVLELNENDIFDQDIAKRSKEYAMRLERPSSMFLTNNSVTFSHYWQI